MLANESSLFNFNRISINDDFNTYQYSQKRDKILRNVNQKIFS